MYTAVGRRSPLYAGACARAILSFLPDQEIETYLNKTELERIATGTITTKEELLRSISDARVNGYTISHSELEDYTSAIAAPILDFKGEVVGGLSIAGIEANYQDEHIEFYAQKVMKAADEISYMLGYTKPPQ